MVRGSGDCDIFGENEVMELVFRREELWYIIRENIED